MSKPIVAVVGRPNVGKSTLFNRLAGERISIVQDTPGVTRDRIYTDVEWLGHQFTMIDTGGMEIGSEEIIQKQILQQAEIAIETADVILFVTDVKTGVTDDDRQVANKLRRTKKPVVLAVNKVDSVKRDWGLGICWTLLWNTSLKMMMTQKKMMQSKWQSLANPMLGNLH